MCFNQDTAISSLNGKHLKLVDKLKKNSVTFLIKTVSLSTITTIHSMEVSVAYWFSSYEIDTVARFQILDETDCISHSANNLGIQLFFLQHRVVGQTGFFSIGMVNSLGKEISELTPVKLRLKLI